jgi:hypothetical protein
MSNKFVETQSEIVRVKRTGNFTQINNAFLRDKNISNKAKGLLCTIMSLPDEWVVKKTTLHQFSSDGRDATIAAFNELKDNGYILQYNKYKKDSKGRFTGITYLICDEKLIPLFEPITNNPITENPLSDNTEQINTGGTNTGIVNTLEVKTTASAVVSIDSLQEYIKSQLIEQ